MDVYVYAKALLINGQPKRTVNWIEQSKLLRCYYDCNTATVGNINDEAGDKYDDIYKNDSSKNHIKRRAEQLKSLQVESLLLSAQAMAELHDWSGVLQLLEDAQYYTFPTSFDIEPSQQHLNQQQQQQQQQQHGDLMFVTTSDNNPPPPTAIVQPPMTPHAANIPVHLDDDDDIAWHQLAESLRPNNTIDTDANSCGTPNHIHPLSRICQLLRAKGPIRNRIGSSNACKPVLEPVFTYRSVVCISIGGIVGNLGPITNERC